MAASEVEVGKNDMQLKHLGFVNILAINVVVLVWKLYGFAKQKSGPLKSTVEKVERVVTAIVRPIYYEFKEVPDDILVFLDNKVDEVSHIFDKRAPPIAKKLVSKTRSMVEKASDLLKEAKVEGPIAGISHVDGSDLPIAKGVGSMVKKASDLVQKGPVGKISKETSNIFDGSALSITKGVGSKAKTTSDLVQEAKVGGPFAAFSHAGKKSKEASNIFDRSVLSITKGVGSMVKKTSDLVQEGSSAAISQAGKIPKEASHIFNEDALPLAKGVGSMINKASDLVQEGPVAAISHAGLPLAKGVGSMINKASDLVQEGPVAAISHAGKISKEASHIFDEYAPPIAKNVVSMAGSMVKNASDLVQVARVEGPFAAISHAGKFSKEFAIRQLVTMWYKANQYSFLYGVLEIVVPIATYLLKKYNNLVKHLKRKGWSSLFSYFPLVPVEEIELAYKMMEVAAAASRRSNEVVEKAAAAARRFSMSDSDSD